MKYKEFKKAIKNSYTKERQAIYENLKQIMDIPDDTDAVQSSATAAKPAGKWRSFFKNFFKKPVRIAACVSAAVAVACLAIILPFTLNNRNGLPAATPPSTSDNPSIRDRFCVAAACKEIELKYSLKEYSKLKNLSLLYVDWYDVAEIKTSLHINKEDSTDIIYYQEILEHKYTGSIVELYISDFRTNVDKILEYRKVCRNMYVGKYPYYLKALWGFDTDENGECTYSAWFQYGKHFYTLVLRYPMDGHEIFELIDLMSAANR